MSPIFLIITLIINFQYSTAIMGDFCGGDTPTFRDCNVCKCFNGFLAECTKYRCNYRKGQSLYVECLEEEMKIANCYLCFCRNEFWHCTNHKICNIDDIPEKLLNNRLKESLIRFDPSPPCERVDQFTFECNSSRVATIKTKNNQDNP